MTFATPLVFLAMSTALSASAWVTSPIKNTSLFSVTTVILEDGKSNETLYLEFLTELIISLNDESLLKICNFVLSHPVVNDKEDLEILNEFMRKKTKELNLKK